MVALLTLFVEKDRQLVLGRDGFCKFLDGRYEARFIFGRVVHAEKRANIQCPNARMNPYVASEVDAIEGQFAQSFDRFKNLSSLARNRTHRAVMVYIRGEKMNCKGSL